MTEKMFKLSGESGAHAIPIISKQTHLYTIRKTISIYCAFFSSRIPGRYLDEQKLARIH